MGYDSIDIYNDTSPDTGASAQSKPYDNIDIWKNIDIEANHTLESPSAIAIAEVQRYLNNKILPRKEPQLLVAKA